MSRTFLLLLLSQSSASVNQSSEENFAELFAPISITWMFLEEREPRRSNSPPSVSTCSDSDESCTARNRDNLLDIFRINRKLIDQIGAF